MDLGLRGRTALVAAASQGLGKAVARALAVEGANVVMFSRDAGRIEAAAREVQAAAAESQARVVGLAADASRPADIERVVKTTEDSLAGADVVFCNAGGPKPGAFDSLSDDDWYSAVDLNLMSAIRLTRLCLPHMRARHWGRVIVSTSYSVKQPIPNLMLSNAVRSATTAWAKTLADQVGPEGITVNTIAPGRIDTERIRQLDGVIAQQTGRSREEVERDSRAGIPLRRYGRADEFGAAAAFLASEQASYLSGVTLLVDGGLFRGTY
ncbi:MAG: SDR family oxidoreductase [Chloroflexi bacterium]|nr:SDR family oxidoreductase [Chloroflexota bacterium]